MSKTIAPSPARLQADDANKIDLTVVLLDRQDANAGFSLDASREPQATLRRIARYLREAFPDTINQPNQPKCIP